MPRSRPRWRDRGDRARRCGAARGDSRAGAATGGPRAAAARRRRARRARVACRGGTPFLVQDRTVRVEPGFTLAGERPGQRRAAAEDAEQRASVVGGVRTPRRGVEAALSPVQRGRRVPAAREAEPVEDGSGRHGVEPGGRCRRGDDDARRLRDPHGGELLGGQLHSARRSTPTPSISSRCRRYPWRTPCSLTRSVAAPAARAAISRTSARARLRARPRRHARHVGGGGSREAAS